MSDREFSTEKGGAGHLMGGQTVPPVDSQPYAGVSEFTLPARMRLLAARILSDLINPCREQLTNALKSAAAATEVADQALASAEAKFQSSRDEQNARLGQIRSQVKGDLDHLDRICLSAEAHLQAERVSVPAIESPDQALVETAYTPSVNDLNALRDGVALKQQWLLNLREMKRPPYWPSDPSLNLFIILTSGAMYTIGPSLALLPPILAFASFFLIERRATRKIKRGYVGLVRATRDLKSNIQAMESGISKGVEVYIRAINEMFQQGKQIHTEAITAANQRFKDDVERIGNNFRQVATPLHNDVNQLWQDSSYAAKEWNSSEWKKWLPDASPEFAARIGTLAISADDLQSRITVVDFTFKLPALIPFAEGRCLLISATGESKDAAAEAMQSVAIRALASTPPGKARFTLIDPVGLGQNVADFMHLGDFNRDLINGRAWTEPQHIEQQLTKLTEDMETVIQTFLRKKFASIQEYNHEHHEVAEPFRFLIIFDFPVNFTESAARRLVSIVKNGPRCGVYTLILVDSAKKLPYGFTIDELRQLAVVFENKAPVSRHQIIDDGNVPPLLPPLDAARESLTAALRGQSNKDHQQPTLPDPRKTDEVHKWSDDHLRSPQSQNSHEVGKIYRGKVVSTKDFGAFVEFLPGREGLCHVSELASFRVKRTEDIVHVGDEIWVKYLGTDEKGRVRLSRKAAMAERDSKNEK